MEKKYPINIEPNNSKHQEIILKVCKAHGIKSLELTTKHIALMSDCISEYIAQLQPPAEVERGQGAVWVKASVYDVSKGGVLFYRFNGASLKSMGIGHFVGAIFHGINSDKFPKWDWDDLFILDESAGEKEVNNG